MAKAGFDAFGEKWLEKCASIAPVWRRAWREAIPLFAFDPAIRKIIYTRMPEVHREVRAKSSSSLRLAEGTGLNQRYIEYRILCGVLGKHGEGAIANAFFPERPEPFARLSRSLLRLAPPPGLVKPFATASLAPRGGISHAAGVPRKRQSFLLAGGLREAPANGTLSSRAVSRSGRNWQAQPVADDESILFTCVARPVTPRGSHSSTISPSSWLMWKSSPFAARILSSISSAVAELAFR